MIDELKENFVEYLLILFFIVIIPIAIYGSYQESKRCKAMGGHMKSLYKSSICIKDGLIIE